MNIMLMANTHNAIKHEPLHRLYLTSASEAYGHEQHYTYVIMDQRCEHIEIFVCDLVDQLQIIVH